ncbi:U32 family peptidase [Lachnospiraceae bacterium JLR.KK008]
MKKVELLAPAGNYEGFLGAIHAGADAVYIGGKKYGARAYAANFTEEEVCLAIRYAHLFDRKLYLTVNTLVKESEIGELTEYIRPFYEAGLDGVIVQDVGVLSLLRKSFPGLPLHGSTQMTITGARGARFLMGQGVSRVVPARELSLGEILRIKETGIEVEAFIHGAMCYCYSGQCLFSSMLGGRSGNRGRCAQPCRLPYELVGADGPAGQGYYLSLKDMCTIAFLPQLIEAGIDSFKIEGRMKKPEYAAGVTAIYRKYIDRCYAAPGAEYTVDQEDMERLRSLYIRSEIQEGYYHRHNGREMITPQQPGYAGTDETYLQEIRQTYLEQRSKIPVCGEVRLEKDRPALLTLWTENGRYGYEENSAKRQDHTLASRRYRICQTGQTAQAAMNKPLTKEAVEKQLRKTGNTPFFMEKLEIMMEPDLFLPVRALNDLRRDALLALEEAMTGADAVTRHITASAGSESKWNAETTYHKTKHLTETEYGTETERDMVMTTVPYLAVQIQHREQFPAVSELPEINRLYIDGDLFLADAADRGQEAFDVRLVDWKAKRPGRTLFLVMPQIVRLRDEAYLETVKGVLSASAAIWDGVLVRNLESLCWLQEENYRGEIIGDAGLYVWNRRAKAFYEQIGVSVCAPLECKKEDLYETGTEGMEVIVYGRTLLMITANCVRKTAGRCPKETGARPRAGRGQAETPSGQEESRMLLRDRYGTDFPVRIVCTHCYNEIYNSIPLSLHEYGKSVIKECPSGIRLAFTTEGEEEIRQVLACYRDFIREPEKRRKVDFSYTKGHYKRGAE